MDSFDDYLKRHPDYDPAQAELMRDTYEEVNEELYRFIMNAIVG
jgi:hypothetical protein